MPAKLWVARHCYAGDPSSDPKVERERPLTPEGRATARAIASAMIKAGEIPYAIFCSPYARTVQTADIIAKTINAAGANLKDSALQVNSIGDLAPLRPLEDGILSLLANGEVKRLLLVGHKDNTTPAMNNFGGDTKWKDLTMGEVRRVSINRKSGKWELRWTIRPSDLGLTDHDN